MQKKWLFFIFALLSSAILFIGFNFKSYKTTSYLEEHYGALAKTLSVELQTLIEEKKNATLSLAVSLSHGHNLETIFANPQSAASTLKKISDHLRDSTDFKNVWIQLIDKNGINHSRSWTHLKGENLAHMRSDVASMVQNPRTVSSISIGKFDLSFKAMVPFYDKEHLFLGFIEVVTHFNSIANKIREKNYIPLLLADPKYKKQLTHPFTDLFIEDSYVAIKDVDPELVAYIADKGLHTFTSQTKNYVLEENYLVVNYPIFDIEQKFLANFLVFVPLESIDLTSLGTLQTNIDLFIAFAFFLSCFLFYLLISGTKGLPSIDVTKYLWIFTGFFLAAATLYFFLLSWYFANKQTDFLLAYNQNIERDYRIILNNYSKLARSMYTLAIDKEEVLDIVAQTYKSKEAKENAREKLHNLLSKEYAHLQSYGIRQLHFQLKDNESFLRFHRPQKYGDNLGGIRATIEYVNANLLPIEGFEEGRIFNGFRHVYPLLRLNEKREQEHLGSVEVAFNAYVLADAFTKTHNAKASFLISKQEVDAKVFRCEQKNYEPSDLEHFMYEKTIKEELEKALAYIEIERFKISDITHADTRIFEGRVFSILSKDKNALMTFVPFTNPVSKKVTSAMIVQQDINEITALANQYIILLISGIATLLFGFLYIYKEFLSRREYELLSQKTQKILDTQEAIVVITNGKSLLEANRQFFTYFGFATLEEFKKEHECICDYFERDDKFFHLGKIENDQMWIEVLLSLPHKQHLVSMPNTQGEKHSFAVSINRFEENYIVSFSDISETIDEHFFLEAKATHDTLTNAYNREYFDRVFPRIVDESQKKALRVGIIIFDIDHFKTVNDTYGHNTGDVILKHLVKTVHKTIRSEDILVRWGGEEFIVLAKTRSLEDILKLAEHIRKSVALERFEEVGHITCSFGATLYDEETSVQESIKKADDALYRAKEEGRNRVMHG